MHAKEDVSSTGPSQCDSLLYKHANKKTMVAQTQLVKNLQVELSGFGKYLAATLMPDVYPLNEACWKRAGLVQKTLLDLPGLGQVGIGSLCCQLGSEYHVLSLFHVAFESQLEKKKQAFRMERC